MTEGTTVSRWLADAATDRLRLAALGQLVDEWEAEHGAITSAELDALESKIALARDHARARPTAPADPDTSLAS